MKILFYDVWIHGIRCFSEIEKKLRNAGHETLLVHTGSYKDSASPDEQYIDGLLCRDIRFYKTNFIFNVLIKEKPDVLFSLNTKYIWDRANVLACRELGIPTVFFMHGDIPIGKHLDDAITANKPRSKFKNKKDKAFLYLFKIIPNYLYSVYKNKKESVFDFSKYKIIFSYLKNQYLAMVKPIYPSDLLHDKCLVYSNKYLQYYKEYFGYSEISISVVGKPEYDTLFDRIERNDFGMEYLPEQVRELVNHNEKYVLYIENGYPEVKLKGWTDQYRNEHLSKINKKLRGESLRLVVKLHPHTQMKKIDQGKDVIVVKGGDLPSLVFHSCLCIVHASTTNEIPMLLGKPIVYPKFEASENIVDYFSDTKTINYWKTLDEEIDFSIDTTSRRKYIHNNIRNESLRINALDEIIFQINTLIKGN